MDTQKVHHSAGKDQRLRLALRLTGFAVVLGSTFFLMRSITLDPVANSFFAVSAGLGFLILVAGWIPPKVETVRTTTTYRRRFDDRLGGVPALQPVAERRR